MRMNRCPAFFALLAFTLLITLLDGCAMPQQFAEVADPADQCVFAIVGDPRLAIIRDKIQLGYLTQPYPGVVSPNERPTPEESGAILVWGSAHAQCYAVGATWRMQNMSPAERSVYDEIEVWYGALRKRLERRELTYAAFSREAENALPVFQSKMSAASNPPRAVFFGSGGCGSRGGPGYRRSNGKCASWRN